MEYACGELVKVYEPVFCGSRPRVRENESTSESRTQLQLSWERQKYGVRILQTFKHVSLRISHPLIYRHLRKTLQIADRPLEERQGDPQHQTVSGRSLHLVHVQKPLIPSVHVNWIQDYCIHFPLGQQSFTCTPTPATFSHILHLWATSFPAAGRGKIDHIHRCRFCLF